MRSENKKILGKALAVWLVLILAEILHGVLRGFTEQLPSDATVAVGGADIGVSDQGHVLRVLNPHDADQGSANEEVGDCPNSPHHASRGRDENGTVPLLKSDSNCFAGPNLPPTSHPQNRAPLREKVEEEPKKKELPKQIEAKTKTLQFGGQEFQVVYGKPAQSATSREADGRAALLRAWVG